MYICIDCGKEVNVDLKSARKVQCSFCGYRILKKARPSTVVRVQAV